MFAPSCIAHCQSVYNEHPMALWFWPKRWNILLADREYYPMTVFNEW